MNNQLNKFTALSKNELRNYDGGVIGIITMPSVHALPKILPLPASSSIKK